MNSKQQVSESEETRGSGSSRPLVETKKAAAETGLSEWELRRGYKEGIYPAILIGRGMRARRLRWDLDLLRKAIHRKMLDGMKESEA